MWQKAKYKNMENFFDMNYKLLNLQISAYRVCLSEYQSRFREQL